MALGVLASPAAAQAATTWYVAPAGQVQAGNSCTDATQPCELKSTVETRAGTDDTVVVEPGSYVLSSTLNVAGVRVTVTSDPTRGRPAIDGPSSAPAITVTGGDDQLIGLDVRGADSNASAISTPSFGGGPAPTLKAMKVYSPGLGVCCDINLIDSYVVADSAALFEEPVSGILRVADYDTLFGRSGYGIMNSGSGGDVYLHGTIVQGAGYDLFGNGGGFAADHSSFITHNVDVSDRGVNQTGGNISARASFVGGTENPDGTVLALSPTVDAGGDASGSYAWALDNPRVVGPASDMGAYETTRPVWSSTPSSGVTPTGATLNGIFNQEGNYGYLTYQFAYRATGDAADTVTAPQAAPTVSTHSGDDPVSATVGGLRPNTAYQFHLIICDPTECADEAGRTSFTTPPVPTGPSTTATGSSPSGPGIGTGSGASGPVPGGGTKAARSTPCAHLSHTATRRCQAKLRYTRALAVCAKRHGRAAAACRRRALAAYRAELARIACADRGGRHQPACRRRH